MIEPSPDLIAGRYRLGPALGRGGMAVVRAGEDLRLGREVAVKLLLPEIGADLDLRARFEAEARTAARLSHPNVVVIHDTGEDDGVAYIVMERLSGLTLADEIREGPMSTERTCAVGVQVLSALAAAHEIGIVHRDVKPSNVLTSPDGTVKVADFGIATVGGAVGTLTGAGFLLGTPAYFAPERLDGRPASDGSDIYAVGALVYECLTGRKPFEEDTPIALVTAIQQRLPAPLAELRPGIGRPLCAVVERAMAKDPAERFSGATEMAVALEAAATQDQTAMLDAAATPDQTAVLDGALLLDGSGDRVGLDPDPAGSIDRTEVWAARREPEADRRPRSEPLAIAKLIGARLAGRTRAVVGLSVVVIFALLVLVLSLTTNTPGSPPKSPASTSTTAVPTTSRSTTAKTIPTQLARALDSLSKAIG